MAYLHRLALVALLLSISSVVFAGCQEPQLGVDPGAPTVGRRWVGATEPNGSTSVRRSYERFWTSDGSYISTSWAFGQCTPDPVCVAPQVLSADRNSCTSPPATATSTCAEMNGSGTAYTTSGSLSTSACMNGFRVRASMAAVGAAGTAYAGKTAIWGPFSCDGSTCTNGSTNTPSQAAPEPCKAPKQSGTVNGVSVCISPSSVASAPSTATASAPAGSASAPTSGLGPSAPPTATSFSKETVCTGANCTTTTTFTNSGGTVVGTQAETKPQTTFCQDNPSSPMCVESRFSGGGCGSVDSCSGDAIQCAIQAQAKKTACAFESSAAAATEENAYTAARAVTGDQTTGASVNSTVNVSASSFDQTNLLGAEVGLSDLTVTVMGRATTLPLSGLNTWFDVLGKLLMGVTAILCMRIVARG